MSEAKQDGGPFFPQTNDSWYSSDGNSPTPSGVSLRQWYAGMALQALLSRNPRDNACLSNPEGREITEWIAANAFACADAMIREGQK